MKDRQLRGNLIERYRVMSINRILKYLAAIASKLASKFYKHEVYHF